MSSPSRVVVVVPRAAVTDCWNTIGVRGDSSCPKLAEHVHCRNCPVYSAAAVELLDAELPAGYLDHWADRVAQKGESAELDTHSVVVFRIGTERLAMPTSVLKEIVTPRTIHSIPHRRNGVVQGLANIRGELLVCFSLRHLLGLEQAAMPTTAKQRFAAGQLLVIQNDSSRAVCPVDEVLGLARFHPRELLPVPATVAHAAATYTRSMLAWQGRSVGLLDEQLLLHTVNRSFA
jgi:chemotaxis-related protein WspD